MPPLLAIGILFPTTPRWSGDGPELWCFGHLLVGEWCSMAGDGLLGVFVGGMLGLDVGRASGLAMVSSRFQ